MKTHLILAATALSACVIAATYPIVDTAQSQCYDDRHAIASPAKNSRYSGQDAQYQGHQPHYQDHHDGTITDLVTGLMWTQDPGPKVSYAKAVSGAAACRAGNHSDWRLPTIKELYSLIQLNGTDPDPKSQDASTLTPFIDASVFAFRYGDVTQGARIIDSQFATSTLYVSTTMGGAKTMFGVNFADGRIKGYPVENRRHKNPYHVLYVRGNPAYGKNQFTDNRDGTITDRATELTWMQADSGKPMDWPTALAYAQKFTHAGHSDWRLPNAKELQSIIDYTRSPDTTDSPALDPIFQATPITNEGGKKDFGHYWTSSTHQRAGGASDTAVYFAFGRSLGFMTDRRTGQKTLMDVHGAGSQRSDPKTGDASRFPQGRGPQGDVIRIQNMVRLVRGGQATLVTNPQQPQATAQPAPTTQNTRTTTTATANPTQHATAFMRRSDRDGDGKISKQEFRGPNAHFTHLDKNLDGHISLDEAPTTPPPKRH